MANKTITQLSPASTISGDYEFAVYDIDGSTTKKATVDQILNTSDLLYADDQDEPSEEVSFVTEDELNPTSTTAVTKLQNTDSWSSRFVKISQMFKNIRYLFKRIDSVEDNLNFIVKSYSYTIGQIGTGAAANVSASQFQFNTPENYTPLCARRVTYNDDKIAIRGIFPTATGSGIALYGKNIGTTASISSLQAAIEIVYVKTELVH